LQLCKFPLDVCIDLVPLESAKDMRPNDLIDEG
jgi:hypothetical protein